MADQNSLVISSHKSWEQKLASRKGIAGSFWKLFSIPSWVLVRLGTGIRRRGEMRKWPCIRLLCMKENLHRTHSFMTWVQLMQSKRQNTRYGIWGLNSKSALSKHFLVPYFYPDIYRTSLLSTIKAERSLSLTQQKLTIFRTSFYN